MKELGAHLSTVAARRGRGPARAAQALRAGLGVILLLGLAACMGDATPTATPAAPAPAPASATPLAPSGAAPAPALPSATVVPATPVIPATLAPAPPPPAAADTPAPPPAATATVPPTDTPAPPAPPPPTTATVPSTETPAPPVVDTPAPRAPTIVPHPPTAAPVPAASPTSRPAPAAPLSPSPIPHPPSPAGLTILASGFGSPDDVTVDPRDGTIYFGDFGNGAINRLDPAGGTPHPVATGLNEPEGIVVLPDGSLIVEEQKTNRILAIDPQTGAKCVVRQLVNTTGQDGVDGLGYDPRDGTILIPDSPNGRLLRMNPDGSNLQVIATGFTRPTGAAVLPDGTLLVADEFGNALIRLTADGVHHVVSTMYQPDDVVVDRQGIAYVPSLGGSIYRVDPATGRRTTLLSGLKLPHGLVVDPQGNLIVAEATRNRLFRIAP